MLERLRRSLLLLILILPFSQMFPSGAGETAGNTEISLSDSKGREIRLGRYPEKVISLGPNITETVFALGRGNLLAGRTDWCDYPAEAQDVPSIGTLQEPNLEIIISMEPDLVIASTHVSEETVQTLEQVGIPVALLYGEEDFSGLADVISGCGTLLGAEAEARRILEDLDERIARVEKEAAAWPRHPRVYYALGFGDGGDWTAGAGTFMDSLITMAGGENIVTQEGWSYSKEMLVDQDPELILMGMGKKENFLTLPIYKDLSASRAGKVYEIDENILVRQGPRLIDGLELLARIFRENIEN